MGLLLGSTRRSRALRAVWVVAGLAAGLVAVPGPVQGRPARRPVTLGVARSSCVVGLWTVTFTVRPARSGRVVDLYDVSDYGNRLIVDTAGVAQKSVRLAGVRTISYRPGASAQ
jgi:hypothetical protein